MGNDKRNKIAAFAAGLGIFAAWFLEGVITVIKEESIWVASAMVVAFGAAGVLRWFLFYEGQQLNEVNPKKAQVVFWCAIGLSVFVVLYFFALLLFGTIEWRTFLTFVLLTATLSVAEYAFAVRVAANVQPEATKMMKQIAELIEDKNQIKAAMSKIESEKEAVAMALEQERKLNVSLRSDNERIKELGMDQIDSILESVRFAGKVVEKIKTHFLFVCDGETKDGKTCNRPAMIGNAQKTFACPDCGKVHVMEKETLNT